MVLFFEMDKIGRFKRGYYGLFAALVILGGALILFWPELSGKNFPPMHAIGLYPYIYFAATKYFINTLQMLPNWWPAYNSGYPINLTLDGFLNPIFLATLKFLPAFLANNLLIIFFFVINGLSLYALARALQISQTASLIAAISYSFSGVMIRHSVVTGIAAVMPFLPLAFLCCLKILNGKLKWFWLWLALVIYVWIGGWAETAVYALTAVGFFALLLIIRKRNDENFSWWHPALFFIAVFSSIMILSPWFLAVTHFIAYSERAGGTGAAAGYMPTTLGHLIHMLNPRISVLYGDKIPFLFLGNHPYFLFIGTLPLLLVLASLFAKNMWSKKGLMFFIGLAAGAILMTVNNSPLFWFFHQIPVLKWFGGYWKWSFIIVFSLALLAGYGFDNIQDFFQRRFSKRLIIVLWIFFAVALMGIGSITIFDRQIQSAITSYGVAHYKNTPDRVFVRSDAYYEGVIKEMAEDLTRGFSFKSKWVILMSLLWLITILYLTFGKNLSENNYKNWRILGILVTFLGSILPWYGFLTGPQTSILTTEPETAKFMHSQNVYASNKLPLDSVSRNLEPYRIFLYTPEQYVAEISERYGSEFAFGEERYALTKEMMDDNIHLYFNFDTFQNHQTLSIRRLADVYFLARQQDLNDQNRYLVATPFEKFIEDFSEEKNMRLLGALNIKYILSHFELKTATKPVFTTYAKDKVPIYIYQNPYFMPRWYFADSIIWSETENPSAFEALKKINDFSKETLLEKLTPSDPAMITKPHHQDQIELEFYTAGGLRLRTKTKNHRFLVFSESRLPDFWRVTINGVKTPIYTANYLYQAVLVPPGENIAEFRYPTLLKQGAIALNKRFETLLKINQ